jgi:acrylyl-CoA reductase (NADPH)
MTPLDRRIQVWGRMAGDLKPAGLESIGHDIGLDDLDAVLAAILAGGAKGRSIVNLRRQ